MLEKVPFDHTVKQLHRSVNQASIEVSGINFTLSPNNFPSHPAWGSLG